MISTTNRREIIPSTQSLIVNISLTIPMHILSENKTGAQLYTFIFFVLWTTPLFWTVSLMKTHLGALYFPFYTVSNIKSHYSFSSYGNGVESSIFYLVSLILFFPEESH